MFEMIKQTTSLDWPGISSINAVQTKVVDLRDLVKRELMANPDDAVMKVAPWCRDARNNRANELNGYLQDPELVKKLKWLVSEAAKAPAAPFAHWTDGWLDLFCVSLEFAYASLLRSSHPNLASEHVLAMLEKVGSKTIDPVLLRLVRDQVYVKNVSSPATENPLTLLADLVGSGIGARLAFANGMVGTLAFMYTWYRLPSAMKDQAIGVSLAPKIFRSLIVTAESLKKSAALRKEWDKLNATGFKLEVLKSDNPKENPALRSLKETLATGGVTERRAEALSLIGKFNDKDALALAALQEELAGPAWLRVAKECHKIGGAFLGLYTAGMQLAASVTESKPIDSATLQWIYNLAGGGRLRSAS
ncbi:hypothetical protein A7982_12688 [Minicystis rosea]|nr:hypothetical protein A7982_12688 [Minicystis rosea]